MTCNDNLSQMENHMYIKKLIVTFVLASFAWLACANSYAQSNDPVGVLQYIANNMITNLKANKATLKTKPQIVYRLAYKYVVPYADLSEMSRRVLSPSVWNSATPAQRVQF